MSGPSLATVESTRLEPERVEASVDDREKAPSCLLCDPAVSDSHQWLCAVHEAEDLAEGRAGELATAVRR